MQNVLGGIYVWKWNLSRGLWLKGARDKLSSFGLGISCGPKGKMAMPYLFTVVTVSS
jgi:hypothetical protein